MNEELVKKEKPQNPVSLKDFIDDYQKTIAVIGVFIALGLFWKNAYSLQKDLPHISYICFLATIPLFIEIQRGFAKIRPEFNIKVFYYLLMSIFWSTLYFLIFEQISHAVKIIGWVAWIGSITLLGTGLTKFFNYYYQRKLKDLNRRINELSEFDFLSKKIATKMPQIIFVVDMSFIVLFTAFFGLIGLGLSAFIVGNLQTFLDALCLINQDIPQLIN